MSTVANYSKTRLGSDQIEGSLSLSPRGKRIVYLVVALVLAAGIGIGVWSAVTSDPEATSANGCVSITSAGSTGGGIVHECGAQAKALCRQSFADTGTYALLVQKQCDLAGLTRTKLSAG